ncbi:MAG TPA: YbhN family protein, partial [Planctomycetota bacterium]|nr:YbhN family protein [Planctomycetota bacterium]
MSKRHLLHKLAPAAGVAVFVGALWLLHHALRGYHYHDVVRALEAIPAARLAVAIGLAGASYLALTGYEKLAFRYIGHPLRYARIAFTAFIGYAFSHSMGLAFLTGGSVRYRLYSASGLSGAEVTSVFAFGAITFWLGFLLVGGTAFLVDPPPIP